MNTLLTQTQNTGSISITHEFIIKRTHALCHAIESLLRMIDLFAKSANAFELRATTRRDFVQLCHVMSFNGI
jgi:hypothetical protein